MNIEHTSTDNESGSATKEDSREILLVLQEIRNDIKNLEVILPFFSVVPGHVSLPDQVRNLNAVTLELQTRIGKLEEKKGMEVAAREQGKWAVVVALCTGAFGLLIAILTFIGAMMGFIHPRIP